MFHVRVLKLRVRKMQAKIHEACAMAWHVMPSYEIRNL